VVVTTKMAHHLRLPSFEALGIASPHPDRIVSTCAGHDADAKAQEEVLSSRAASLPSNPDCVDCHVRRNSNQQHSHRSSYQSMLTPPDETADLDWSANETPEAVNAVLPVPSLHLSTSYDGSNDDGHQTSDLLHDQEEDGSTQTAQPSRGPVRAREAGSNMATHRGDVDEDTLEECIPDRPWLEDALSVLGGFASKTPRCPQSLTH
jgi:hypothetical protein